MGAVHTTALEEKQAKAVIHTTATICAALLVSVIFAAASQQTADC